MSVGNSTNPNHAIITPNKPPLQPISHSFNTPHCPSPFSTPQRRKNAPNTIKAPSPNPRKLSVWPRLGGRVPIQKLEQITGQIFGYAPRSWQTKVTEKVLQGHDVIAIAGTGAGKSLIFAMLATAEELVGFEGIVVVICPLKALQHDQVRRFTEAPAILLPEKNRLLKISAVAVNEDNHEDKIFTGLAKGRYRICYVSPECLLRNLNFKKLFRRDNFRQKLVAMVVDETHVIESWKGFFRKDYGGLETLRIIAGTGNPWLALTGTKPSK